MFKSVRIIYLIKNSNNQSLMGFNTYLSSTNQPTTSCVVFMKLKLKTKSWIAARPNSQELVQFLCLRHGAIGAFYLHNGLRFSLNNHTYIRVATILQDVYRQNWTDFSLQSYAKACLVDERIRFEKVAQMHLANLSNHIKSSKLPRRWSELALQH